MTREFYFVIVAVAFLVSVTTANRILEAKEVAYSWVQEQKPTTFLAAIPKSNYPCGRFNTHEIVCFFCLPGACGEELRRHGQITVHYDNDISACQNRFTILTNPSLGGYCAPWFPKQAMIL